MGSRNRPVARFRIYATSSLYFEVLFFETYRAMYAKAKALGTPGEDYGAICIERTAKRPQVGYLLFTRPHLSDDVIAHELFHAIVAVSKRLRLDLTVHESEERAAAVVGRLTQEFWGRYYRRWPVKVQGI